MAKRNKTLLDEFMEGPDDTSSRGGQTGWLEKCERADPVRTEQLLAIIDAWIADEAGRGPRKKAKTAEGFRKRIAVYIREMIGEEPAETTFRTFIRDRKANHGKA